MYISFSDLFNQIKEAKTEEERIKLLRKNDSIVLRTILTGVFHPNVKFVFDKVSFPEYQQVEIPEGLGYTNIFDEIKTIYLFQEGNTKRPKTLTLKRTKELLIQILEAMEPKEAVIYASIIKKDLNIPEITYDLVYKAFPRLLPPVGAGDKIKEVFENTFSGIAQKQKKTRKKKE